MKGATKHYLWFRWVNMIRRCYDIKAPNYKSYGAKGIYVEEYLRNFKNYINFIETLPNIDKLKKDPNSWQIDKDLKSGYFYSRDSVTIMKSEENLELENKGKKIQIIMLSLDGKVIEKFESMYEAETKTGIHRGNISRVIRGESKTAGGYKWRNNEVSNC